MQTLYGYLTEKLNQSQMRSAYCGNGRYYLEVGSDKLFAVNLFQRQKEVRLMYGWAWSPLTQSDRSFLQQYGVPDTGCVLRYGAALHNRDDLAIAADAMFDSFYELGNASREQIVRCVQNRKKSFLGQITARLRPLGFSKRGENWFAPVWGTCYLTLHAQHISGVDRYAFHASLSAQKQYTMFGCYRASLSLCGEDRFDWQAMTARELGTLTDGIYEMISPVLRTDFSDPAQKADFLHPYVCGGCDRPTCRRCFMNTGENQ